MWDNVWNNMANKIAATAIFSFFFFGMVYSVLYDIQDVADYGRKRLWIPVLFFGTLLFAVYGSAVALIWL